MESVAPPSAPVEQGTILRFPGPVKFGDYLRLTFTLRFTPPAFLGILGLLILSTTRTFTAMDPVVALIAAVAGLSAVLGLYLGMWLRHHREWASYEWEFGEEAFALEHFAGWTAYKWSAITAVRESKRLLYFTTDSHWAVLPKRHLDAATETRLRALIRAKVGSRFHERPGRRRDM